MNRSAFTPRERAEVHASIDQLLYLRGRGNTPMMVSVDMLIDKHAPDGAARSELNRGLSPGE